ncbi:helix-turn-helix domain-containing protein [Streptomyces sp. 4N509B]|uniref:helix-turn-helix domain-containing protein n=1 Tax=Streptomyces sp. 4N509B TaxID=3457413 RepID=UPI003FD0D287
MGLRTHISQRQRRLGRELRKLREAADVSRNDVCRQVGLQPPHLSNIEAGRTACSEHRLRALAEAYGCTSAALIDALVEMSLATGKGWWSTYRKLMDGRVIDLAELESTVTTYRSFEWLYVPGLLQTPEYMRALFTGTNPHTPPKTIDEYVGFRLQRQQILTDTPLSRYHAVIHETAFHMQFVSRQVMQSQLEHLVELAQFPNVTIQVLPLNARAHPGTPGAPFSILDVGVPELSTVYVDHPVTSVFLDDRARIDRFTSDFERLSNVSLAPLDPAGALGAGSLGLVQHLLYTLKEGAHAGS